jgi:hypothetical protein
MRAAAALSLLTGCGFSLTLPGSATTDDAMIADDATTEVDAATIDAPPNTVDAPPIDAQLCLTPPAGLIAWWPGDTATEVIGNRTSVLVNGATAGTTGKVGGTFNFDGFDDRVDIVDDVPPLTIFTIEGWIDFGTSTSSWRTVFGNDISGPGFWMKDRRINWFQSQNDRFISNVAISTTGWHHFALVYGADQVLRGYVDGEAAGATAYAEARLPQNSTIGGRAGYELEGKIDELSIYSRALSVVEIGSIVDAAEHGKCR